MFGLKDISINFLTGSPVMATLALIVLVALSVYLYRRTNPPLPLFMRLILNCLRVVALLALFAALFEPVMSFGREYQRPKRVALLLDHSSSMGKTEEGKSRSARLDSLLSSSTFAKLSSVAEVRPYYLGGNLVSSPDKVDREKTALGEALYQLEQQELAQPSDYWVLFSDGRSNTGREPEEAVKVGQAPIIAVDMTAGGESFDVGLADIDFNPVVFAGQQTEVSVKLTWQNALNKNVKIELLDSSLVLDERSLTIAQEGGIGEAKLKYIPSEPGQQMLTVFVPPLEGEETADNNQRSFAIKVLKSRLAVLIVTDRPDYEVGFLKRLLAQSDKYDVDLKVTGTKAGNLAGRFPERQTELNRYDLVILYDPNPQKLERYQDVMRSYLSEKGGAIWVLMGEQFSQSGTAGWFNRLLPFYQTRPKKPEYVQFHAQPAEGNLFHPAVRLADNQSAIREVWSQLPPFESLVRCDTVNPEATVLAYTSIRSGSSERLPVLGYLRFGPGKLFASAALPFWTWGFVKLGFGGDNSTYAAFIEGVVSWLTVKEDFDPIHVAPEKEVFTRGETVVFNGHVYDLGFRPIPGVTGTVRLQKLDGSEAVETDLVGTGEGKYQAQLFNLSAGRHRFVAKFEKDGRLLKQSEGTILIESFSLEEFDQSGNPALLTALAKLSGGDYFTYKEFSQAVASINPTPVVVATKGELVVWNKFWLLVVIIAALSMEWFLRKAFQLV
jgi:hypothetical protein